MNTPRSLLAWFVVATLAACRSDPRGDGVPPDDTAVRPDAAIVSEPDLATDRLPWDRDLSLVVRGLGASEGKTAWLRIYYTVTPTKTAWRQATIANGVVSMFWAGGFDSNTFGEIVELFVDRDGDGACNEGTDPAWQLFINNAFMMRVNMADTDVSDPRDGATPRTCAELTM
jgi:hypothetical protein